jgi:peptidoglycan/xylan/chitin deacetylase (PgdA/CDA1 family)
MTYKSAIKTLCSLPIIWKSVSAIARKPGLIVLMYHRVGDSGEGFHGLNPSMFYQQMRWIKKNCRVIYPRELTQALQNPSRTNPPVLVTFDDGYKDFYDQAYPVLCELNIPAIVFLPTKFIDEGSLLWTDQIHLAALKTNKIEATLPWKEGRTFQLRTALEREAYVCACKTHLKGVEDDERNRLLDQLINELDVSEQTQGLKRQMMNWNEIRNTLDLIDYGGHTHTHPIMSKIDSVALEDEIRTCRDRILKETSIAPKYFAYPNGRREDFNVLSQKLLKKHGFEIAFTTIEGINGPCTDYMEVARLPTTTNTIVDFAWLLSMA